jgi:hypothetical protein
LVATDAWHPQINGVVRTFERMVEELGACGIDVTMLAPSAFRTIACPTYPEIRLAISRSSTVRAAIVAAAPDPRPHRNGRAARLRRPALVSRAGESIHDQLSY